MARLNQKTTLDLLLTANERLSSQAQKLLELESELLNNKPDAKSWSVLECFDHMNKASELYLDQIEAQIEVSSKPAKNENYKCGLFANFFIKGLKPTEEGLVKNKMKTLNAFVPLEGSLNKNVIDQFVNNKKRIFQIIDQLRNKDLNSFKVVTALGKVLKFNVGDALRFITAHNERHMLQAERVLTTFQNI